MSKMCNKYDVSYFIFSFGLSFEYHNGFFPNFISVSNTDIFFLPTFTSDFNSNIYDLGFCFWFRIPRYFRHCSRFQVSVFIFFDFEYGFKYWYFGFRFWFCQFFTVFKPQYKFKNIEFKVYNRKRYFWYKCSYTLYFETIRTLWFDFTIN